MSNLTTGRIELVDALRGFALCGILLLHATEHFSFMQEADKSPEVFALLDPYIAATIQFLFKGKAFTIFSLLFGFSFYTLMHNHEQKGIDFASGFAWRLVVLFLFGYLFSAVLLGEILTKYALLGLPLIFCYRLRVKTLVIMGVLLLMQLPTWFNALLTRWGIGIHPDLSFLWPLFGEAFGTYANGSLQEVLVFNLWKGHIAIWTWALVQGKLLQTFGLFVLGLAVGKSGLLKQIGSFKAGLVRAWVISIGLFGIFKLLLVGNASQNLVAELLPTYINLTLSSILILSFILFYLRAEHQFRFSYLAAYGRMSLTNYVVQPLLGIPVFYGFGLGLYPVFGPTLSLLVGMAILIVQLYFSFYWMKYFRFGPLEWCWRACSYLNFKIPIRRIVVASQ